MSERRTTTHRRQRRKEARPPEIIDAALAEFALRGFAAARLEDVAARAGVSKATIYVYFADKQALFEACVKSRIAPAISIAGEMIEHFPGTTEELLRAVIVTIHRQLIASDARELLRIIISEGGNFPFLAELHHRENITRGKALIERIVARGIARGELRDGDYARAPFVIAGPAILAMLWTILFQRFEPIDLEVVARAHVDLVLHGVLKPQL
jgi:AcrR family transcriptional regulator